MNPAASCPSATRQLSLSPLAKRVSLVWKWKGRGQAAISSTTEVMAEGSSVCRDPEMMLLWDLCRARFQWHTGQVYGGSIMMGWLRCVNTVQIFWAWPSWVSVWTQQKKWKILCQCFYMGQFESLSTHVNRVKSHVLTLLSGLWEMMLTLKVINEKHNPNQRKKRGFRRKVQT